MGITRVEPNLDRPRRPPARAASRRDPLNTLAAAVAGPAAIVAGVLIVLRAFAFQGRISIQYPDVLPFWLPTYCFLGKSLAAGHVPAWNPHVMGGIPFASDPQSGWLYLPAMVLFALLSCGTALRWFIVLQPLTAGLGLYAFLRTERLSRPAATVGGLALAMPLASSYQVLNLPFSGAVAWTAVLLAVAARFLRAERWPARLGWLLAAGVAWGQVAGANLTDGLMIATGALALYAAARLVGDVRAHTRPRGQALAMAGLLAAALPAVNLAVLIPRLAYLPRTSLGLGYQGLEAMSQQLTGRATSGLVFEPGTGLLWPLRLVLSPGMHLGAVALALAFAGWAARGRRHLAGAFALFGLLCYVLMLQAVSVRLAPRLRGTTLGDLYLHDPSRFRFGLLISIAVLAGVGVEAWRQSGPRSWPRRVLMLAPAIAVWGVLPPALHVGSLPGLLLVGALAGAAALAVSARRPTLVAVIPAVLFVELVAGGIALPSPASQAQPDVGTETAGFLGPINPLTQPVTLMSSYFAEADRPIVRALRDGGGGRYQTLGPGIWDPRGYHIHQHRISWGLLGMQQSMLFGLEEGQGYNPAQLVRFWTLVRALDPKRIRYNAGYFDHGSPVALDLLQVNWAIAPSGRVAPVPGATKVAVEDPWALYRLPHRFARASLIPTWSTVATPEDAVAAVTSAGFAPGRMAVVEGSAGTSAGTGRSSGSVPARYVQQGPQAATVVLDADHPGIVLIRNAYDPNWHATLDGAPTTLLPTDDIDQGVAVGPGRHVIRLTYDDPWVGYGLLGSGLVLALFVLAIALSGRRARRLS
jgi:hypothetical protein